MNENRPRLMEISSDGQALKPAELEGQPITILKHIDITNKDGRASAQWLVRTPDGRTRVFWSAGKDPTLAVEQWFIDNPRLPLHCMLTRSMDQWGNNVWHIEQLDYQDAGAASVEDQLTEAGL